MPNKTAFVTCSKVVFGNKCSNHRVREKVLFWHVSEEVSRPFPFVVLDPKWKFPTTLAGILSHPCECHTGQSLPPLMSMTPSFCPNAQPRAVNTKVQTGYKDLFPCFPRHRALHPYKTTAALLVQITQPGFLFPSGTQHQHTLNPSCRYQLECPCLGRNNEKGAPTGSLRPGSWDSIPRTA